MRSALRDVLRERYSYRCGYCGVREADAGAELTIDHFQPRAHGGSDEPDNLVYCCHACNEFKGDWWSPQEERRILHPLDDDMGEHVREAEDGVLHALTATGAFHLHRLNLDRHGLVAYRRERRLLESVRAAQEELLERVAQNEQQLQRLQAQIEILSRTAWNE